MVIDSGRYHHLTAGKTAKTRGCGAINTILLQMFSGKTVVASKSYFG